MIAAVLAAPYPPVVSPPHTADSVRVCFADSGSTGIADRTLYVDCYRAYRNMFATSSTRNVQYADDAFITAAICEIFAGAGMKPQNGRASLVYIHDGLQILETMSQKAEPAALRPKARWFLDCVFTKAKKCTWPMPAIFKGFS